MRFSKEEKRMWLDDWKQSNMSAWAYAKENGLSPQTFFNWTKSKNEKESCFIEVPAQVIQHMPQAVPEILIEKGDVKIHIPLAIGGNELRKIIEGLGAAL